VDVEPFNRSIGVVLSKLLGLELLI